MKMNQTFPQSLNVLLEFEALALELVVLRLASEVHFVAQCLENCLRTHCRKCHETQDLNSPALA